MSVTVPTRKSLSGALATAALAATMLGSVAVTPAVSASAAPVQSVSSPARYSGAFVSSRTYSKTTVAKHHTASNCWTIIDGKVYNLTRFVAKHPGGRKRIIRLCGHDGSAAFHGQHSRGGRASTVVLKRYKIGKLRK